MTFPSFTMPERGGPSWAASALHALPVGATVGSPCGFPDQRVARAQGTKLKAIIRHSGGSTASLRPRVGGFHPSAVVCEDHRYVLQNLWDAQQATTRVTRGHAEERGMRAGAGEGPL